MASPNATFTEMVTTTIRNRSRQINDNVSNNNALLSRLNSRGNKRREDGGRSIVVELDYAENATWQRYSGYDVLNISASDVLTAAEYPWVQAAVNVTASGREMRQNAGRERMINLVRARINNAMRTFSNNISSDIYSDGSAANQMNGLQAIVPDTAGGSVGGIDGDTFAFWKSVTQSAASLINGGSLTPGNDTMEQFMQELYLEISRGSDRPDLIVMTNDYYQFYWESLTSLQRYGNTNDTAVQGFNSLKFVNADVVFDGGTPWGSMGSTSRGYMLNTNYLYMFTHPEADMTPLEEKMSVNQDAVVIPIIWQGNLACSNRALQGVMTA